MDCLKRPLFTPCSECPTIVKVLKRSGRSVTSPNSYKSRFFHHPCSECDTQVSGIDRCPTCVHIRLRHFFVCLVGKYKEITVRISEDQKPLPSEECRFCWMIKVLAKRARSIPACHDLIIRICPETTYDVLEPNLSGNAESPMAHPYLGQIVIAKSIGATEPVVIANFDAYRASHRSSAVCNQPVYLQQPFWSTGKEQIQECDAKHFGCHQDSSRPLPAEFRVIDVERKYITRPPPQFSYAALSYVWGEPAIANTTLIACKANIEDLEMPGSLASRLLPATIGDALEVCLKLGIRYLWVDRLCIVQDDASQKHQMVKSMDQIFSQASITLVAMAGEDLNHGLPGVSARTLAPQLDVTQELVRLRERTENAVLEDCLKLSKWNTRGWTFQEAFLSRRLLLFWENAVFHECVMSSGKIKDSPPQSEKPFVANFGLGSSDREEVSSAFRIASMTFFQLHEAYASRELSVRLDSLDAFTGVLNRRYGDRHYFGLPLQEFDFALLWRSKSKSPKTPEFPSWSWVSMEKTFFNRQMTVVDKRDKALYMLPLLTSLPVPVAFWAVCQAGELSETSIQLHTIQALSDTKVMTHLWEAWDSDLLRKVCLLAWKECMKTPLPFDLRDRKVAPDSLQTRWKSYRDFWNESRGITNSDSYQPLFLSEFSPEETRLGAQGGRVLGFTQSATLSIRFQKRKKSDPASNFTVWSKSGILLGYVHMDEEQPATGIQRSSNGFDEAGVDAEFLALAVESEYHWKGFSCSGLLRGSKNPTFSFTLKSPKIIVMYVQKDGDVYRRRGLGQVDLRRWKESASATFKTCILE